MTTTVRTATPARPQRSFARRYLPRQHGAWAMLLLPFAVGVLESGPAWVQLPLLVAWVGGYLTSYYVSLGVKTRRPARVAPQVLLYAPITLVAAVVVLRQEPELLAFAPLMAVLLGVNIWSAWRKDERSIVNDLAAVALASLMVPLAAEAGGAPVRTGWLAAGLIFLYLGGTAFYVKTMIRERGSVGWRRASALWHAVAVVPAAVVAWPLGVAFGWFLVRAVTFPSLPLRPRTVGLVEVGNCVLLLALVPLLT